MQKVIGITQIFGNAKIPKGALIHCYAMRVRKTSHLRLLIYIYTVNIN